MNPAERLFLERYIRNPKRNLLRFSFVFMVLGIVLSVGILSAALNLFEGYERALRSVLLDSFPHLRVQSQTQAYMDSITVSDARKILSSQPEVFTATPVLSFSLMAHNGKKVRGGIVNAYTPDASGGQSYSKYVLEGDKQPEEGKVIVGKYLAGELGLTVGDTLNATYPRLDRITPLGMYPTSRNFIIGGIYSSGYYEYDRSLIISTIGDARKINGQNGGYNYLEVKLKNEYIDDAAGFAADYAKLLPIGLLATPVLNPELLNVVRMQKWLIFIIFSFLVLIAGINVISSVGTLIYDKKNEIAVLKALGAGSSLIRNILAYQLMIVCLASILLGQVFGFILSWLVVKQDFYRLKGDVYFIDRLELFVSPLNQAVVFLVAAALVTLCVWLPLMRIRRMRAIDLLRNL